MPRCMLCGEEHRVITNTHLKYYHNGMTQYEYQKMFPGEELFPAEIRRTFGPEPGSTKSEHTKRLMSENHAGGIPLGYVHSKGRIIINEVSEETRKLISEGNLKFWSSPEGRELISRRGGWKHSEETKRKIAESCRGRIHTEEARQKISKALTGRVFTPEWRQRLSEAAQELWGDPEYAEKQQILMHQGMRNMPWSPTMPEILFGMLLEENFPNTWRYNGRGGLVLGKYIPDFVRKNGTKQVIEVFGMYWHPESDEEVKKDIYKKFGYDCLVIWDYDIWIDNPKVIDLISSFMKGGG